MTLPSVFSKGHGTGNDFVIFPDDAGSLTLNAEHVRQISDRHTGIGCDGVLRVVPTQFVAGFEALANEAPWFMDYRNADGTVAEMCGNGVRVFAHYLMTTGRVEQSDFAIATRGGVKGVRALGADHYEVAMGRSQEIIADSSLVVRLQNRTWTAYGVTLPNPHAVVFVEDLAELGGVLEQPAVSPVEAFPTGANFEFVVEKGERHVAMRVHERGVGETLSCGTGACAVAWAARRKVHAEGDTTWQVDVPGGTVFVKETAVGELFLSGPAVLVASGEIAEDWWLA